MLPEVDVSSCVRDEYRRSSSWKYKEVSSRYYSEAVTGAEMAKFWILLKLLLWIQMVRSRDSAKSYWSSGADGNQVTKGGVGRSFLEELNLENSSRILETRI